MMKYLKICLAALFVSVILTSCGNNDVVMHAHSFGSWQIEIQPTCTEDGILNRTCKCGYTEQTEVKALSHLYSDRKIINEPSCTDRGLAEYTCNLCGETKREILNKAPHSPSPELIATDEYHARKCTVCDTVINKEDHYYNDGKCVICQQPVKG